MDDCGNGFTTLPPNRTRPFSENEVLFVMRRDHTADLLIRPWDQGESTHRAGWFLMEIPRKMDDLGVSPWYLHLLCMQYCYWNFTGDNYLCAEDKRLAQELSAIPKKTWNGSPHDRWLNHVCKLNSMFIGDKQNGGAVTCLGSKYHSKWWNAHSWWSNPHDLETIWNYWINLHHIVSEFFALCSPCGCRKMPLFYTADLPTSENWNLRWVSWRQSCSMSVMFNSLHDLNIESWQPGNRMSVWVPLHWCLKPDLLHSCCLWWNKRWVLLPSSSTYLRYY